MKLMLRNFRGWHAWLAASPCPKEPGSNVPFIIVRRYKTGFQLSLQHVFIDLPIDEHQAGVRTAICESFERRAHHINGLDFNLFGVYQFGSFSGKQISAFSAAIDAGYKLFNLLWAPRIAGSLQVSSGDSSLHGSRLETFNPMFPAGYYYGGPLNEQIGLKNAIILQPEVDLHPTATLGIYLKTLFVWREDTADGLYDTPGFLVLPG